MMAGKACVTCIVFLFMVMIACSSHAEGVTFGANGGISDIVGDPGTDWKTGFSMVGFGFYDLTPKYALGFSACYNDWSPNDDELRKWGIANSQLENADWAISGSYYALELGPFLRISPSEDKDKSVNFYGTVGLNAVILEQSKTAEGTDPEDETDMVEYNSSETAFGISLGGGMVYHNLYEFVPAIHVVFAENDTVTFFTVNIGFSQKL